MFHKDEEAWFLKELNRTPTRARRASLRRGTHTVIGSIIGVALASWVLMASVAWQPQLSHTVMEGRWAATMW